MTATPPGIIEEIERDARNLPKDNPLPHLIIDCMFPEALYDPDVRLRAQKIAELYYQALIELTVQLGDVEAAHKNSLRIIGDLQHKINELREALKHRPAPGSKGIHRTGNERDLSKNKEKKQNAPCQP